MSPETNDRPRRRVRRVVVLTLLLTVSLGAVLALAHRPLLTGFASLFRVDDAAPSDALVVLSGGESDRALEAAELYHRRLAPVILMGCDCDTKTNLDILHSKGVPAEAIRTLCEVATTHDEAICIRDYVRSHPLRRITVVTTAYHTARARWAFRRALRGTGVEVRMAATDDSRFDETNWYRTVAGRRLYLRELAKTICYRLLY